jgi:2-dehydropantoate 2-reductase
LNVLCVGAGAVGGVVAARLTRAGLEPVVVDRNDEHVRLARHPGLIVDGIDEGVSTPLNAATLIPDGPAFDLVLLAVRSQATKTALVSVITRIGDSTDVVSLQNGINEDTIASIVGHERTIGCVVGIGATWIEPGRISLDANGELTIGRLDGTTDGRLRSACEVLGLAFPTKISTNIYGDLWAKMLVNSMTVLGALGGMLTGELLVTRDRRSIVAEVVAEGVRVAMAAGIELPMIFGLLPAGLVTVPERWAEAMERVLIRVGEAYGAIKSVTWRDFELGRPTEIDAVTGEIARRGDRHGVPTPMSTAVYAMLREIERGDRSSDAANIEALSELATA